MGGKKNIVGWEEILANQPEAYKKWFEEEKKFFIKHINKNSKILEVGCGNGRSIKDMLNITKDITGIDHDETAIEHAKNNFKKCPSVKIILAEGANLPFVDKTFDYVTCIGTFANFSEEKYKILEEMKRVLKEEGKIVISVYSEDALSERLKAYRKIRAEIKEIKENGKVIFDDFGKDGISEQFSKKQLSVIFKKVGLSIEKIKKAGIGYICKLRK
ncbi:MAG: class I SAM-dependent methyltransferase [Candidatus Pacearchaeota archaeon]